MLRVYFHNVTAFNVREGSHGFIRTFPSLCSFLPWRAVIKSEGVFVTVDHKMQWCSPCTSESIFMLLQNRTLCSQQR